VTKPTSAVIDGKKCGDNVTIIKTNSGKRVYKEFCYYLRESDNFNHTETKIKKADQRWPPNRKLLKALGEPYSSWEIEDGPFGIKILVYDYIEGTSSPTSRLAWIKVLKKVEIMHSLDYVHGDLLPRNLIFDKDDGYVIDFDLMREEGGLYVSGYNHSAFGAYRHKNALAGNKMQKEHDFWALMQMSKEYFADHDGIDNVTEISGLVQYFEESECEISNGEQAGYNEATGSPVRASTSDIPVDQLQNMRV
jgi:serine/threonine protein kinase